MNARHKLNVANCLGSVLIAGLVGRVTESLAIFVIVIVLLIAGALHSGDIRIQPRSSR